jgi:hypothetical protein
VVRHGERYQFFIIIYIYFQEESARLVALVEAQTKDTGSPNFSQCAKILSQENGHDRTYGQCCMVVNSIAILFSYS